MHEAILITGAGRRVGLHLAKRLSRDGHPILAHYRTPSAELDALRSSEFRSFKADLTSHAELRGFVAELRSVASSLRAIIHNASLYEPTERKPDKDLQLYESFFRLHMVVPYFLNEHLTDLLEASSADPSDIVHITDIYAQRPNPAFDLYCSTKAGLQSLSKSYAKRLAPRVKVNSIAPGPVLFRSSHSSAARERVLSRTLIPVEAGPEVIYLAVRALLDNPFVTGTTLPVDGGRSLSE